MQWPFSSLVVLTCLLSVALVSKAESSQTVAEAVASPTTALLSNTQYAVPVGWITKYQGQLLTLVPPEDDLHVAIEELNAPDAASAIAATWTSFEPSFKRQLVSQRPDIPQDGWTERYSFRYADDPNDQRFLSAFAWRSGDRWLAIIVSGNAATRTKRRAQLDSLIASLKPVGFQPESFSGRQAHAIDSQFIHNMNDFVVDAMHQLKVPGVAVGFIDGGKPVYSGGFGVRQQGHRGKVNGDTRFAIASTTKVLTTLLLAELVDRQQLRWDEPVSQVYPAFKLGDPELTNKVEIQDLPCMCTGIPEDYIELYQIPRSAAETLHALAGMKPVSPFGQKYHYSNFMVDSAGFIAGASANPGQELGTAYTESMERLILRPVGMRRSTFDFAQAMKGNYARPHDVSYGGNIVTASMGLNYSVVNAPSGGLWSTANDLTRYVAMELSQGELPDGTRLVSMENLTRRYMPSVDVHEGLQYGLGLMVNTQYGVTVIYNAGDIWGYHSTIIWLPAFNTGAVLLNNGDRGVYLRRLFQRRFLEKLFDGRSEASGQLKAIAQQQDIDLADDRSKLKIPAECGPDLAHNYFNDSLGKLRVRCTKSGVDFDFGGWHSVMGSRQNADGSMTFETISPTVRGFAYTLRKTEGHPALEDHNDSAQIYVFEQLAGTQNPSSQPAARRVNGS